MLTNQNKTTRIRTVYILKLLHTGCSTKEAIKLLPLRSPKSSRKVDFCRCTLDYLQQTKIKKLDSGHYTFWNCYIQRASWKKQYLCFLRGTPESSRLNAFYTQILGKCWQIKTKKLESGHYTFWNCYIQGAPQKKHYLCFFRGAPQTSRLNAFYTHISGQCWQVKTKKLESGHYYFKIATERVVHERSNKTASFLEHLKVQEKSAFADALWIKCRKLKSKT